MLYVVLNNFQGNFSLPSGALVDSDTRDVAALRQAGTQLKVIIPGKEDAARALSKQLRSQRSTLGDYIAENDIYTAFLIDKLIRANDIEWVEAIKDNTQTVLQSASWTTLTGWADSHTRTEDGVLPVSYVSGTGAFTVQKTGDYELSLWINAFTSGSSNRRITQVRALRNGSPITNAFDSQYNMRNTTTDPGSAQFIGQPVRLEQGDVITPQCRSLFGNNFNLLIQPDQARFKLKFYGE